MPLRARAAALLLAATALAMPASAQTTATSHPERGAVLAVVHRLFDGRRRGDSAAVRSVFHPQVFLATAVVRKGTPVIEIDTLEKLVTAVGTPHDEVWDERLSNEVVHIDGSLASVWTDYSFYVGSRFSHCGVDAFQIAKAGGAWRIIALTDTRRREGCPGEGAKR